MGKKAVVKILKNKNLVIAFLLTTLIFILGIFIGNYISNKKAEFILSNEEKLRLKTFGLEVQTLLIPEYLCENSTIQVMHKDVTDIGGKLTVLENQLGWNNPEVMKLKEFYSLLEIRSWIIMQKYIKNCGSKIDIILYFYSNKEDCESCWLQGSVLDSVREDREDLVIYSFDITIENPALDTVKKIFSVNKAPTLIINGKKYEGFMDKKAVLNALLLPKEKK
jgi:hypothetical protein